MASKSVLERTKNTMQSFEYKKGKVCLKWNVDIEIKQDIKDSIECFEAIIEDLKSLDIMKKK